MLKFVPSGSPQSQMAPIGAIFLFTLLDKVIFIHLTFRILSSLKTKNIFIYTKDKIDFNLIEFKYQ